LPFVIAAGSCGPGFQNRVPDVAITKTQIAVLPPITRAFELDRGKMVASPEKQTQMQTHLGAAIAKTAQWGGSRLLTSEELATCGEACDQFVAWSLNVAGQVLCRTRCEGAPPRTTVADWEFDGDLPNLRAQLKADFVLFTAFQEAFGVVRMYQGGLIGAAVTAAVESGEPPLSRHQYGMFCIASLKSGHLIWCDEMIDKWSFLNKPASAQQAVTHLLAQVYGWPRPAGY